MDGHEVRMVNRFPAASAEGIDVAGDMNLAADNVQASAGSAVNSLGLAVPSRRFDIGGGTAPNCRVTYLEAGAKGAVVVGAETRVVTDGC